MANDQISVASRIRRTGCSFPANYHLPPARLLSSMVFITYEDLSRVGGGCTRGSAPPRMRSDVTHVRIVAWRTPRGPIWIEIKPRELHTTKR